MSIFPAYSNDNSTNASTDNASATSWLNNSSFTVNLDQFKGRPGGTHDNSSSSDDRSIASPPPGDQKHDEKKSRKHKRKKKEKKTKRQKVEEVPVADNELYFIDKTRNALNLKMTSMSNRLKYERAKFRLPGVYAAKLKLKKKKPIRYYSKKFLKLEENPQSTEDEVKAKVETLNKAVYDEPRNLENWFNLINFQNDHMKFQSIQFKTTGERDRAVNSQKLAILERAMAANPDEEALQKMWLNLAIGSLPVDEVESQIMSFVNGHRDSLIFCLGSTMLIQQSIAFCTVPAVMNKYRGAMERLQRSKHLDSSTQDNATLELFYCCMSFLEQCGLWEMAWLTLQHMYSLNLSMEITYIYVSDDLVLQEENKILEGSKSVPIWHLWSRLETIRQGYHFLPVNSSENFPQRVTSTEETSELIHHVRKTSHCRLLMLLPLLAKVPLLPRSHSLIISLFPQATPWTLDSVEWQLSAVFYSSPILKEDCKFFKHLPPSHPPQYLKQLPGQLEYLKFATEVFNKVLDATSGRQRIAFGVWYLRFLRWLDMLSRYGFYKPPEHHDKTKLIFKQFLWKKENREVILFFVEYALWEYECVDAKASIKSLSSLVKTFLEVPTTNDDDKADMCFIYRTLSEIQIAAGLFDDAKETLRQMCRTANVNETLTKLKDVALDAQHCRTSDNLEDHLLPNFTADWLACYAFYLSLNGSCELADGVLTDAIESSTSFVKERLLETKLALIKKFEPSKVQKGIDTATKLHCEFPLNSSANVAMATFVIDRGGLWWRNMNVFLKSSYPSVTVTGVCALMERQQREDVTDNRSRALLKELTTSGRTSALIHRMYLRLLSAAGDVTALDAARVLALEAFPWDKSIYLDAISSSPAQLLPLTDILVEKDLRIHITPDEIEALRD